MNCLETCRPSKNSPRPSSCQLPAGTAAATRGVMAHSAVLTSDGRDSESLTSRALLPLACPGVQPLTLILSSLASSPSTLLDQCSASSPSLHPFFPICAPSSCCLGLETNLGLAPGRLPSQLCFWGPHHWLFLPVHTFVLLPHSLELSQIPPALEVSSEPPVLPLLLSRGSEDSADLWSFHVS